MNYFIEQNCSIKKPNLSENVFENVKKHKFKFEIGQMNS